MSPAEFARAHTAYLTPPEPYRRACHGCGHTTSDVLSSDGDTPCCAECGEAVYLAGEHSLECACALCHVHARVHSRPPPRGTGDATVGGAL